MEIHIINKDKNKVLEFFYLQLAEGGDKQSLDCVSFQMRH